MKLLNQEGVIMTLKNISSLFLGSLLLVLTFLGNSLAGDKELQFSSTTAGTFFSGNLNTNAEDDSFPVAIGMITAVSGELKNHSINTEIEVTVPLFDCDPSSGDPGPGLKSTLVQGSSVFIIPDQGGTKLDQIFFQITELTQCTEFAAPFTPPFRFTAAGEANVTGGTGRFVGVTGTATFTLEGQFDLITFDPVVAFHGRFTGTQQGTLVF
jgi:hypothetical protein